jgi:hypothetical protein
MGDLTVAGRPPIPTSHARNTASSTSAAHQSARLSVGLVWIRATTASGRIKAILDDESVRRRPRPGLRLKGAAADESGRTIR